MMKEVHSLHAEARIFDWRGDLYDAVVRAPRCYGVTPQVTICLDHAHTWPHMKTD